MKDELLVTLTVAQLESVVASALQKAAVLKSEEREVLTRAQAAELLQVSPDMVIRLVSDDGLPGCKLGVEWRFRRSELLRWFEERERKHAQKGAA